MDSAINPTLGVGIDTIIGDFRNFTGGTITKGYVGVCDIYCVSHSVEAIDAAATDGPTSRYGRMISPHQAGATTTLRRSSWCGVFLGDSLTATATGTWLIQGWATAVQCLVEAADAAALAFPIAGTPSATYPGIYSFSEAVGDAGKLALRDSQGGVNVGRRGIFAPTDYLGDDVDGLLSGLFLGMGSNSFGHYTL